MAIFTGNWLDGEGAPFDPSAQHHRHGSKGNTAQHTRHGRGHHFNTFHFAAIVTYHAAKWLTQLTSGEQEDWATIGDGGLAARNSDVGPPVNGFCPFNALHFVHSWYPDAIDIRGPTTHNVHIGTVRMEEPDLATQAIRFQFQYDHTWAATDNAAVAVYQVHPRCIGPAWGIRSTRLIFKMLDFGTTGRTYHADVGAAFPFSKKTDAAILFRAHSGTVYLTDNTRRWTEPP